MATVERDELKEVMDCMKVKYNYMCYLKFSGPDSKHKIVPLLLVSVPHMHFISIGVPLDEIMRTINQFGVDETCFKLSQTITEALNNFKRDNPGFNGGK